MAQSGQSSSQGFRSLLAEGTLYFILCQAGEFMRLPQSVLTILAIVLFDLISQRVVAGQNAKALQELIDAAPAGGEVKIPKGTHAEPLTIAKAITLRGE